MIFEDRQEAGKLLAERLLDYKGKDVVVVALPRGGVPVGYEIAKALEVPFAVLPVRKIGAPFNPEFAIGAIAPGGIMYIEERVVHQLNIADTVIAGIVEVERKELERREKVYGSPPPLENKIVILTDDGMATGLTAKAAIAAIKKQKPQKIILAVPGCPLEEEEQFDDLVDEFVCLEKRQDFSAVGMLYKRFEQVSDDEVMKILENERDSGRRQNDV